MKDKLNQHGIVSIFFIIIAVIVLAVLAFVGYTQYKIKQNIRKAAPQSTQNNQEQAANTLTTTNEKGPTGTLKGQILCTEKVDDQPCQSDFTLMHAKSTTPGESVSSLAQTVQSDLDGKYSVNIAAGSYNITPSPKKGYPVIVPIGSPVIISAGQTTSVTIRYMDGTR